MVPALVRKTRWYRRNGRDVCRNSAGNLLRSVFFVVVEHLFARFKKA